METKFEPRRSSCANASLAAEIERVRTLSVRERILECLRLRGKFAWLDPTPVLESNDDRSGS